MHWSHARGHAAEERVIAELARRGYWLLRRRWRTPVAEVDLLVRSGREYLLVEVKTVTARGFAEHRLRPAQRKRLVRAREWVAARARLEVRLCLAWVPPPGEGKIMLFNLEAADLR